MITMRIGQKPLRLLVLSILLVICLTGCSGTGYEAVDLSETTTSSVSEVPAAVSIGMDQTTGTDQSAEINNNGAEAETEEMLQIYENVEDQVIVTADVLNVRKTDSTEAGIHVQLPRGEILKRTGFNEEWCRIIYDGDVAYVAADMVELYVEPESSEANEESGDLEQSGEDVGLESPEENLMANSNLARELPVQSNGYVVAIDAGHQAKANAEKEPIGPDSETMKAKMPEGTVGTETGVPEYQLTLAVAQKLEEMLKEKGYEVVMIRNSHDVNLSNAERSEIANESDADIFIRLHANSMENSSVYGALAMCMTEYNPYNSELYSESYKLSKKIIDHICALTGTKNRGVQKVDNSSAINWCEIPVSVIEMGFLTNPDEDRWLQDEEYQYKIVSGITAAIDSYFAEGN